MDSSNHSEDDRLDRSGDPSRAGASRGAASATLAVRVWRDDGAPEGFRGRVLRAAVDDVESRVAPGDAAVRAVAVATTAAVLAEVRHWLDGFRHADGGVLAGSAHLTVVRGTEEGRDEADHPLRGPGVPELRGE